MRARETNLIAMILMLPFTASAQEQRCTQLGSVCACSEPLDFAPGERFNYSNSGYVLLGALIERVSGEPYERFVAENIFEPLALKQTGSEDLVVLINYEVAVRQ